MSKKYKLGMIGLGTMGRNLVHNISEHGFSVAGFDKDASKVESLKKEATADVLGAREVKDFVEALEVPRIIMLLVPAGPIVDDVLVELKPFLTKNDLVVDCGNSHFTDTTRRMGEFEKEQMLFMGVGISGGEEGARKGPSIMPGGNREAYKRIEAILSAIAAKVDGEPCVAYLGEGASGHYVKMVHNGIEYALMQLLGEAYHLLKVCGGLNNEELHEVFLKWNEGPLQSFLIGIASDIFIFKDPGTGNYLLDLIMDTAGQKGTGAWTSQSAMDLQAAVPSIDAAVTERCISAERERRNLGSILIGPEVVSSGDKKELAGRLEDSIYFCMILIYSQGMDLLVKAASEYEFSYAPAEIARIWRGGCIIRAAFLENIRKAYAGNADLISLMLDKDTAVELSKHQTGARNVIKLAIESGIPVPCIASCLSYYDAFRSAWLPANLVQAQRDYFGAHTYKRLDKEGTFHTNWTNG